MVAPARITRAMAGPAPRSGPAAGALPDMSGRLVGQYRVGRRLGEGGMSAVYEAVHDRIGRRVAIKVLGAELAREPDIMDRFFNEARAVSIIQHPDIVSIYEMGQLTDGTAYLVMEYLQGEPLSARLQRLGRLPLAEVLRLGRQIAAALQAVHDKGIVHRDLKPDNIIIVPDAEAAGGERAKILDFGIAKLAEEHKGEARRVQTRAGMVLGTPVYMAPEQCRGAAQVDARADVYSLGIIFYEMVSGQPPFTAEGEGELVAAHIYEEPVPLREAAGEGIAVPPGLSELVQQMLEKERALRPSMAEVGARLEALGAGRPSLEVPVLALAPALPVTAAPLVLAEEGTVPDLGPPVVPAPRPRRLLVPAVAVLAVAAVAIGMGLAPRRRPAVVAAPAVPRRPMVRWVVLTQPEGAEVVLAADGRVLGRTPLHADLPAEAGLSAVVLRHAGFLSKRLELDRSANVMVSESLALDAAEVPAAPLAPVGQPARVPVHHAGAHPRQHGKALVAGPVPVVMAPPVEPPPQGGAETAPAPRPERVQPVQDFEKLIKDPKPHAGP